MKGQLNEYLTSSLRFPSASLSHPQLAAYRAVIRVYENMLPSPPTMGLVNRSLNVLLVVPVQPMNTWYVSEWKH
jgi:hypothetical protein